MEDTNTSYQMHRLREENEKLKKENESLRKAAKLIAKRHLMTSGSLEMGECDEFCSKLGLKPWDKDWRES